MFYFDAAIVAQGQSSGGILYFLFPTLTSLSVGGHTRVGSRQGAGSSSGSRGLTNPRPPYTWRNPPPVSCLGETRGAGPHDVSRMPLRVAIDGYRGVVPDSASGDRKQGYRRFRECLGFPLSRFSVCLGEDARFSD